MKDIYTLDELKQILSDKKPELSELFNVADIFVFGSYAKGLQTVDSDIDLLVETSKPISLFKFVNLKEYFKNLLGKEVDLGTPSGLKSFVKNSILQEAVKI